LQLLEKSEKKIDVNIDANTKTVDTIQYTGRADINTMPSEFCFVIDSKEKLKGLLLKYGYELPTVDFDKDMIVYYHPRGKAEQIYRVEIDAIGFEKGQLHDLVKTEYFSDDKKPDGKTVFALIVLPHSVTK
jgi:hypothetical protein